MERHRKVTAVGERADLGALIAELTAAELPAFEQDDAYVRPSTGEMWRFSERSWRKVAGPKPPGGPWQWQSDSAE